MPLVDYQSTIAEFEIKIMYKFSIRIILDIGCEKYRQKFNINFLAQSFGEKYCSMLASIYVFTGEDVTSA